MKIVAIDIRLAKNQRGIASYIVNLLINFKDLINDSSLKIYLLTDSKPNEEIKRLGYDTFVFPIKPYPLWDIFVPFFLSYLRVDLFHSPGNTSPFFKFGKIRYITTIHDLIFFNSDFSGNLYQKIGRFYLKVNLLLNIYKSDKIISVSNSTKEDLLKRFNLKESKIAVIYESCHSSFHIDSKDSFLNLNSFICFGSDDPRKNTEMVLKTFDTFVTINSGYCLDVIGLPSSYITKIKLKLNLKNTDNFRFYPFISRENLLTCYRNAIALIYPSLYEGFGVPIIEGFKTKTPVITSNISSLPEIASDAAILIDPNSEKELLKALNFIIVKQNFEDFSLKSGIKALDFDWKNFSNSTFVLYNEQI